MFEGKIVALVGVPGSGKSLLLQQKIEEGYLDGYRVCWTNCPLNLDWWQKRCPKLEIRLLTNPQIASYWKQDGSERPDLVYRAGIIVAIDEVHLVYDSREFKKVKEQHPDIVDHWCQIRHCNDRALVVSQAFSNIVIYIRERIEECEVLYQIKIARVFIRRNWTVRSGELTDAAHFWRCIPAWVLRQYMQAYDTHGDAGHFTTANYGRQGVPPGAIVEDDRRTLAPRVTRNKIQLLGGLVAFTLAIAAFVLFGAYRWWNIIGSQPIGAGAAAYAAKHAGTTSKPATRPAMSLVRTVSPAGNNQASFLYKTPRKIRSIGGQIQGLSDDIDVLSISGDHALLRTPDGRMSDALVIATDEFARIRQQRDAGNQRNGTAFGTTPQTGNNGNRPANSSGLDDRNRLPRQPTTGGSTQPN